jgi:hypothetical protein
MSGSVAERRMAVVLASIDAAGTFRGSLERWLLEMDGPGEVIVVDASRDGTGDAIARWFPQVRLLRRVPGSLAPELWRDGLEATEAEVVAFSTTQMFPAEGWRRAMLERLDATGAAAVGGPILPSTALAEVAQRAVYLHRYVQYQRPLIDPERVDPPGDNAVYRRDRLAGLEPLWKDGFWEVEIHRALRGRGELLTLSDAAVRHYGIGPWGRLLRQRYVHARHFGASRARHLGRVARLVRIVAAPVVPAVLLSRIVAALRSRGHSLLPWLPTLPYLLLLLAAWSLGEALGLCFKRPSKRCWHGRQRTRGWFSGGRSRFSRVAARGRDNGRARVPAGGRF